MQVQPPIGQVEKVGRNHDRSNWISVISPCRAQGPMVRTKMQNPGSNSSNLVRLAKRSSRLPAGQALAFIVHMLHYTLYVQVWGNAQEERKMERNIPTRCGQNIYHTICKTRHAYPPTLKTPINARASPTESAARYPRCLVD